MNSRLTHLLTIALSLVFLLRGGPAEAQSYAFTRFLGPEAAISVDGTGSEAFFSALGPITMDPAGNVYVVDFGTIRMVSPQGAVTTIAGRDRQPGVADGYGSSARFFYSACIARDRQGNLYVTDDYAIRKITPAGLVSTIAGKPYSSGYRDGAAADARFLGLSGIAVDTDGTVYVGDSGWDDGSKIYRNTIRKVTKPGIVSTIAGPRAETKYAAVFDDHYLAMAIGPDGNVYVTDGHTIRRVTPDGDVSLFAGTRGVKGSNDGVATEARFSDPAGVAFDSAGNLYVADTGNERIRRITPGGAVTTVSILGPSDGPETHRPLGIGVDSHGTIWFTEAYVLRKTEPYVYARPADVAGKYTGRLSPADGPIQAARFSFFLALTSDGAGNLYAADLRGGIRRISNGVVSPFVGSLGAITGLATDTIDNIYVAEKGSNTILRITPSGKVITIAGNRNRKGDVDGPVSESSFDSPQAIAVDRSGSIWIAQRYNIRRIDDGVVTTVAGVAGKPGSSVGSGSSARFNGINSLVVDSRGNAFVADDNRAIRKITRDGSVSIYAGSSQARQYDGWAEEACFCQPTGLAIDRYDNLYVADCGRIRKVTLDRSVTTIGGNGEIALNREGNGTLASLTSPKLITVAPDSKLYIAQGDDTIFVGQMALPDTATIDAAVAVVGGRRQLDVAPPSAEATQWRWRILRRPAGSTAELSSTSIRNPLFTPDVPDLYVFELLATSSRGASVSTLEFVATAPPRRRPSQP